jgi:MSHA biogenesis protein MshI
VNIAALTKKWVDRVKPYIEEKQPEITTHRCAIYLAATSIQLVHINKTDTRIEILETELLEFDEIGNLSLILSGFIKAHQLELVPIYWLLTPEDYQLFLIDSLPVPENELRAALSWRVRSLITYPIQEAALDYFMIPAKKSSTESPMIGTVTARKNVLEKTIKVLEKAGMALMIIDIPELALKNLSSIYENDEKCTAFLYFSNSTILLNITKQKMLFFSRHISYPANQNNEKEFYEQLSLEIMRYFDYFQSQWRLPAPSRIFVASDKDNADKIAKALTENLLTQVDVFSLLPLIEDEKARTKIEKKFLLAFGSALREGNQHVPTRD